LPQAIELNPVIKVLTISDIGEVRQLGSSTFVAELLDPSRLRSVVAALLQSNDLADDAGVDDWNLFYDWNAQIA
jgi:hypothetical protein